MTAESYPQQTNGDYQDSPIKLRVRTEKKNVTKFWYYNQNFYLIKSNI